LPGDVLTTEPGRVGEVAVGAVTAAVFWQALQLIGTWYVTRGVRTASPTYGVFAVVITLLSWLYFGAQLTLWSAEINVVLRYHLWPRSVTQPPLTKADRLVFQRLAQMEVRRPEVKVAALFTEEADEDPSGVRDNVPPGSASEQLSLGRGEFVVAQDALLMQVGKLVQLVDHRRTLRRGRCLRRRGLVLLLSILLLFESADAIVLICLVLRLLRLAVGYMLTRHVRAAAHHGRAHQRSPSEHHCLLVVGCPRA
jgi:hypothetical protein